MMAPHLLGIRLNLLYIPALLSTCGLINPMCHAQCENVWGAEQSLHQQDPNKVDRFGTAVGIDGDLLAVTAQFSNLDTLTDVGSVIVFRRESKGQWQIETVLLPPDPRAGLRFGDSVAVSGGMIAVGCVLAQNQDQWDAKGAVYLFERDQQSGWHYTHLFYDQYESRFGASVDLDGSNLVEGAPTNMDSAWYSGKVNAYFRRSDGTWSNQMDYYGYGNIHGDTRFGQAVAVSGDRLIISEPSETMNGVFQSGYVEMLGGGTGRGWKHTQDILPDDLQENAEFGWDADLDGDWLVITAPGHSNFHGVGAGAAYVFKRDGNGRYNQHQLLFASDGVADDSWGRSAAIAGDTIVIGHTGDDHGTGSAAGAVYVFQHDPNDDLWYQIAKLTASPGAAGDAFGCSVAVDLGGHIAIGAKMADQGQGLNDAGEAWVFSRGANQLLVRPPSPGFADSDNRIAVECATPGKTVYFLWSQAFGTREVPRCPGLMLDVDPPQLLGTSVANSAGRAHLDIHVPRRGFGVHAIIQALEPSTCRVSRLTECVFE